MALVASLAVLTLLAGAAAIGPLLPLNEAAMVTLLAVVPFAGSVISAVYLDWRHGERAGSDVAAARRSLATLPMSTTSSRQVLLVPPALAVALLPAVVSWAASTQAPPSAPAVQFHQVLSGQNADSNVRVVLLGDRPLIAVDAVRPSNSATPALVLCADRACTRSRKVALGGPDAAAPALTAVAGGSAAVALWHFMPGEQRRLAAPASHMPPIRL